MLSSCKRSCTFSPKDTRLGRQLVGTGTIVVHNWQGVYPTNRVVVNREFVSRLVGGNLHSCYARATNSGRDSRF